MELSYSYTLEDITHADGFYLRKSGREWLALGIVGLVFAYGLFSLAVYGCRLFSILMLIAGPLAYIVAKLLRRMKLARLYVRDPRYRMERLVRITDEGVETVMEGARSEFSWGMIASVMESPKVFVIEYSPFQYVIVPKRVFADESRTEDARHLFAARARRFRPAH